MVQVHDAIGPEPPFGLHASEPNLECPVGKGIRPALSRVYGGIEQTMRRELAAISVADVLRDTCRPAREPATLPGCRAAAVHAARPASVTC